MQLSLYASLHFQTCGIITVGFWIRKG